MGCGSSKGKDPKQAADKQSLKAEQAGDKPGEDAESALLESRPHLTVVQDGSLVQQLFPKAKRPLSLCGRAPASQQPAFAERPADLFPSAKALSTSGVGCACKKGLKPESPNQDEFFVIQADDTSIFGVLDGHGPYGDSVAAAIQDFLPRCMVQTHDLEESPEKALEDTFEDAQRHVCQNAKHCQLSGATATVAVHNAEDGTLHIAHAGDCRAVLCRKKKGKLLDEALTEDHVPSSGAEAKRVRKSGEGELRRLQGDKQDRVFLKGKIYPGLTITRSIGDIEGSKAGVTCKPEVLARTKGPKEDWQFLLICSDGVWQVMSTKEAVDIVGKHSADSAQRAADNLASEAWNRWVQEEENVVDDVTVVCYFFDNQQRREALEEAKEKEDAAKSKKGKQSGKKK